MLFSMFSFGVGQQLQIDVCNQLSALESLDCSNFDQRAFQVLLEPREAEQPKPLDMLFLYSDGLAIVQQDPQTEEKLIHWQSSFDLVIENPNGYIRSWQLDFYELQVQSLAPLDVNEDIVEQFFSVPRHYLASSTIEIRPDAANQPQAQMGSHDESSQAQSLYLRLLESLDDDVGQGNTDDPAVDEPLDETPPEEEFVPNPDCADVAPSQVIVPEKVTHYIDYNGGKNSATFQLILEGLNNIHCPYTISTEILDSPYPVLEVVPVVEYKLYTLDLTQTAYGNSELSINITVTSDDFSELTWNYIVPVENINSFVANNMQCTDCDPVPQTLPETVPEMAAYTQSEIYGDTNVEQQFVIIPKLYYLSQVVLWSDEANSLLHGFQFKFSPDAEMAGWEDQTVMIGTDSGEDVQTFDLPNRHLTSFDLKYGIRDGISGFLGLDLTYSDHFRFDMTVGSSLQHQVDYRLASYDVQSKQLVGFRVILGPNSDGVERTIRRLAPIFDENSGCGSASIQSIMTDIPKVYYRLGSEVPYSMEVLQIVVFSASNQECGFSITSDHPELTIVQGCSDTYEDRCLDHFSNPHSMYYYPSDDQLATSDSYSMSLKVTLSDESYNFKSWQFPVQVEVMCDYINDASCEHSYLPALDHSASIIESCFTFTLDFATPASFFGYQHQTSEEDPYFCAILRYGTSFFEVDFPHNDNGLKQYTYAPGVQKWQAHAVRVSFGTKVIHSDRCQAQGQVWGFKVIEDCRDYDSEPQSPYTDAELEVTLPVHQAAVNMSCPYIDENLLQDVEQMVPHKYYKISHVFIWSGILEISGLLFRFEMPSEFTGYPPVYLQFGSTGRSSKFSVVDVSEGYVISKYYINVQDAGLRVLNLWVMDQNFKQTQISGLSNLFPYTEEDSIQEKSLTSNMIGAKVTQGPSRDGNHNVIWGMNFIVDEQNCELAIARWDSGLVLIQHVIFGLSSDKWWNINSLTPWRQACGKTYDVIDDGSGIVEVGNMDRNRIVLEVKAEDPSAVGYYTVTLVHNGAHPHSPRDTFTFNVEVTVQQTVTYSFCPQESGGDGLVQSFDICNVFTSSADAQQLACPPVEGYEICSVLTMLDFDYEILSTQILKIDSQQSVWSWQEAAQADELGSWAVDPNFDMSLLVQTFEFEQIGRIGFSLVETTDGCTSENLPSTVDLIFELETDCLIDSSEKTYPSLTRARSVDQFTMLDLTPNGLAQEQFGYYLYKFYRISQIRMWRNDEQISGFRVKWETIQGVEGYSPHIEMFGSPSYLDHYQRWDVPDGYEITELTVHSNLGGQYLKYLKFTSKNVEGLIEEFEFGEAVPEFLPPEPVEADEIPDGEGQGGEVDGSGLEDEEEVENPYEGLHYTQQLTTRIIGFNIRTCRSNTYGDVAKIYHLTVYTTMDDCQTTDLDYFQDYGGQTFQVNYNTTIDFYAKSEAPVFGTDCLDIGKYQVWNFTEGLPQPSTIDMFTLSKTEEPLNELGQTLYQLSISPNDLDKFQHAMNNKHTLGIVKRYMLGTDDDYRTIFFGNFNLEFSCVEDDETRWPFVMEAKCNNYLWCQNNYRADFFGQPCEQFDNCLQGIGEADGTVNSDGIECRVEKILHQFDQAQKMLEQQYPAELTLRAGDQSLILLSVVQQSFFSQDLQLLDDFGDATGFVSLSQSTGEITIAPPLTSRSRVYSLTIILDCEANVYQKTLSLTIEEIPRQSQAAQNSTGEYVSTPDLPIFASNEVAITVIVGQQFIFKAQNYITQGIGTVFNKIELLQLVEFSELTRQDTIKIEPTLMSQISDYPFVVRATDRQNNPVSKQFVIKVISGQDLNRDQHKKVTIKELTTEETTQQPIAEDSTVQEIEQLKETPNCDASCTARKKQDQASQKLFEIKSKLVVVKRFEVRGVPIEIKLDELAGQNKKASSIADIMGPVKDMPTEVQQAVFDVVLEENTKYQEQQRVIKKLYSQAFTQMK